MQLGQFKHDGTREARFQGALEENDKVLSILSMVVSSLYDEDKCWNIQNLIDELELKLQIAKQNSSN